MREAVDKIKIFVKEQKKLFAGNSSYHLASLSRAPEMAAVIWEINRALERGISPERCIGSTTEAYFLKDCQNTPIAIFKIPKPYSRGEMKREIAAYQLDHAGFAGVPPTVIATLDHFLFDGVKQGACQLFVQDSTTLVDFSSHPSIFSPAQVRKIASLDIRLLNNDRHSSNLLFASNRLFPIDHGICLPTMVHGMSFLWMTWEQSKTSFTDKEKYYLSNIDIEKDRYLLIKELGIEEESANLYSFATMLLKKGAQKGWNAYEIGLLMRSRLVKDKPVHEWAYSPFYQTVHKILEAKHASWQSAAYAAHCELEKLFK